MTLKEKVEIAQAIVTIGALFVGGLWTYDLFIKERQEYPHINIEQKISHLPLSDERNLLRVGVDLANTGKSLAVIKDAIIRVQQILPQAPCPDDGVAACAATELNDAAAKVVRQADRFTWPLIGERTEDFGSALEIEPDEKQSLDFEFVTASNVRAVRVYTYFRNEQKSGQSEIGWAASSYYDFHSSSWDRK